MEKLHKVSEIARMLNVSTVAVRKLIRAGKLNAMRVGKLWMIPESELKRSNDGSFATSGGKL